MWERVGQVDTRQTGLETSVARESSVQDGRNFGDSESRAARLLVVGMDLVERRSDCGAGQAYADGAKSRAGAHGD